MSKAEDSEYVVGAVLDEAKRLERLLFDVAKAGPPSGLTALALVALAVKMVSTQRPEDLSRAKFDSFIAFSKILLEVGGDMRQALETGKANTSGLPTDAWFAGKEN